MLELPARASAAALSAAEQGAGGHAPSGGEIFNSLFGHLNPHPLTKANGEPMTLFGFTVFNFQLDQLLAIALIVGLFGWALAGLRGGRPNRVQRVLVGFVLWIRDEMVFPIMGHHHGQRFLPYFLSIFFFIALSNLIGLFPLTALSLIPGFPHLGATSTASPYVTAGLAALTLILMVAGGMVAQGPVKFWVNLVPHGIPAPLWPIMFVVEVVGLIVKPVALTIRLFANMTAGHLVVLSFMGLIFFFAQSLGSAAYAVAVPAVGLAVFIMIIEAFVALLQAYIFTLLSIQFVQASIHPEH